MAKHQAYRFPGGATFWVQNKQVYTLGVGADLVREALNKPMFLADDPPGDATSSGIYRDRMVTARDST